ncbi:hypothetical protein GCM10012288_05420 [Malaciobacter pacificus]|uniref:Sulfite reductase, flavoprotein component n=1 Tax=Malaciobacter pacificus TaxID=1080223 RepID=A0A5C2H676_9BACT|nr:PepSY-associated TM helix domain-containing protein [Malaciobacter pacificus]QEP34460.1 sulfite reductase, flavoprotein component [Malaciobacter pacificus]GGD34375.1 hypothetical protein GCM10012288_05420 [Malaciobacter pacificus]
MHKKIWFKIHWFLGITAGIILLIVGTTGAILSFEKEILKTINSDSYVVQVTGENRLSNEELLEKFQTKMPGNKIQGITFFNDESASVIINVQGAGNGRAARKGIDYFVNPYNGEILPGIVGKDFFGFVLRLHRWLALPGDAREIGKQTVAISTISLIILIISAIIIYWGRIKHAFFKSFTFKFKHKGRAFLSTMHSAIGMWVIPLYLLASLTGLYWSYDWYRDGLYAISGVEKKERKKVPMQKVSGQAQLGFDSHAKAITIFKDYVKDDYSSASFRFPNGGSFYSFRYFDKEPAHYRASNLLELDINTQKIIKVEKYEDKPLNEKLMGSILPLHTGEYFGVIGQTAMFIAAALMSLFTITGFMLYFNRKNKKKKRV